ncbi:hypothetical protein Tco_0115492 [Tanacetum coccineum]
MFNEYFNPLTIAISPVLEAVAPRAEVLADSPMSTSIDQDAPSTSIPSSQEHEHFPIISQGFEESPKTPTFHDDPLNESPHEDSTSQGSSSTLIKSTLNRTLVVEWTKDHPIENHDRWNITLIEPKNFKQAMTELSWIDAMQEEIHEFERLEVWELRIPVSNSSHDQAEKNGFIRAPRAWYDMLSSFLISQQFTKGAVDPTLFTRHAGNNISLVQIYVDDININAFIYKTAMDNRIDIGKCNGRIPRGLTPREPTLQVVLDAIALTPCYPTFLITADVPEVYMHQFWNSVYKHDNFYRFKIDKKKRIKLTLEVFRDIF